ncbi:MAG: PDZ domain-containing protein [Chthoniobacterales bacterium]
MKQRLLAFACLVVLSAPAARAADKAWYGFHLKIETAGFVLNPIVRSVVIDKIAPNSPAAEKNLRVGDEILEADGQDVPGGRALQLRSIASKSIGESLQLRLKRPSGERYSAVLQGVKKPGT